MEHMFSKREEKKSARTGGHSTAPFASLTAGLMARKGEAVPAPAHLDGVALHSHGVAREPLSVADQQIEQPAQAPLFPPVPSNDDVGEPPQYGSHHVACEVHYEDAPEAIPEEVLRERAARRATANQGDCCALPLPPAVTETLPPGPYAKVTTRLDKERVRKLKIIAARMGASNQKVLLAALDHYLDYAVEVLASECPCLARSFTDGE